MISQKEQKQKNTSYNDTLLKYSLFIPNGIMSIQKESKNIQYCQISQNICIPKIDTNKYPNVIFHGKKSLTFARLHQYLPRFTSEFNPNSIFDYWQNKSKIDTNEYPNIFVSRYRYKWISEYICIQKFGTNEYLYIFLYIILYKQMFK